MLTEEQLAAIQPLIAYAETSQATDPGEGYWDDLDTAFGCGERAAQYGAAETIRGALTALGIKAPAGYRLCNGCSRSADGSAGHDFDCTAAPCGKCGRDLDSPAAAGGRDGICGVCRKGGDA